MTQAGFIKTACQGCEGRLELPLDAVGVTFACPRCGTKLQLALKCACINCGGPLSFEIGHIGQTIQCGHCNSQTPLMPSAILADAPGSQTTEQQPEPEPEPEPKQREAAVTQPLPIRKPAVTPQASGGQTTKTPNAPKRPAGAGGPTTPVSGPPKRPAGAGGPTTPVSGPPKRPAGAGGPTTPVSGPPKRPAGAGGPTTPVSGPPKRPGAADDSPVPEGVKPPGQAPSMPKMGGGPEASGAPPKRPAAAAGPQKQGGVASPSDAASSRQAAIAQTKAKVVAESADKATVATGDRGQLIKKAGVGIAIAAAVGGLAWFVIMPYFGFGGSNLLVQARNRNPNATVFRPVFDASAIKVDPASLSISPGNAGIKMLSGSVKNSGSESARNIKITVQIAGNEITHTVNKEVRPGQSVEFEAPLSFEPPLNPQITVKKIEIH